MKKAILTVVLVIAAAGLCLAQAEKPLLLQKPTVSGTQVAFVYAGDLWIVGREGGDAKRLTTGIGLETDPIFSPDGALIAFTGEYDGNLDVYVVPATGGVPKRLTYHPGVDAAVGWTPDGKQVLFRSGRNSYSRFNRLFTVPVEGGFPSELPLPMAEQGSYSPDGARLAYVPFWNRRTVPNAYIAWKRYRGGLAPVIWIAQLSDSTIERVPHTDSSDFNPMWVGDKIYFLSDRNGPVTLFAYDLASKKVTQVLRNGGPEVKSASAGPGVMVYEQFGSLHLLDLKTGHERKVEVRVAGDLLSVRPHFDNVGNHLRNAAISPTGARAVFEARGEIITVPAERATRAT